jgi:hypothetical protein
MSHSSKKASDQNMKKLIDESFSRRKIKVQKPIKKMNEMTLMKVPKTSNIKYPLYSSRLHKNVISRVRQTHIENTERRMFE